eukprot:1147808-Pelagomonas_calceolata.AAC.1
MMNWRASCGAQWCTTLHACLSAVQDGDLSLLENGYLPFRAQSSALLSRTSSRAPGSRRLMRSGGWD